VEFSRSAEVPAPVPIPGVAAGVPAGSGVAASDAEPRPCAKTGQPDKSDTRLAVDLILAALLLRYAICAKTYCDILQFQARPGAVASTQRGRFTQTYGKNWVSANRWASCSYRLSPQSLDEPPKTGTIDLTRASYALGRRDGSFQELGAGCFSAGAALRLHPELDQGVRPRSQHLFEPHRAARLRPLCVPAQDRFAALLSAVPRRSTI